MGNLVSFPLTYPDEDFRSIIFRYYLRSPITFTKTKYELFGEHGPAKAALIPLNLSRIENQFELTGTFAQMIVENHTFYPFLRPFIQNETQLRFWEVMYLSNYEKKSRNLLIRRIQSLIHSTPRYCSDCMNEDFYKYRIVYLHRIHQFSFLHKCLKHNSKLIDVCPICDISLTNENCSQMLIEPICPNGHEIFANDKYSGKTLDDDQRLIDDIAVIMKQKNSNLDTSFIKFISYAGAKGYIHFRGDFIYKKRLLSDLSDFYGSEYLTSLGLNLDYLMSEKVLVRFLQKNSLKDNFILYLLVMRFFAGKVENWFVKDENYSIPIPFGNGPWLCINTICPQYNKRVISKLVRKAHEWVTARLTCPYCGMIYTRRGMPKTEDETQYSIETMGSLFIEQAVHYYENGLTLDEIATKLLSNRTTIRKYLMPHRGLTRSKAYPGDIDPAAVLELGYRQAAATELPKIEECRNTLKEALATLGSSASRQNIRKYNIHRYDWLMKNDRVWMEESLPSRKPLPKKIKINKVDEEMFVIMKKAVETVKNDPPTRPICMSSFFKVVPKFLKARYYNFQNHLPRTTELLKSNIESIDDYAIRIFPYVVEQFLKSRYRKLTIKRLQTFTGVYKKCSPEVLEWAVQEAHKYYK